MFFTVLLIDSSPLRTATVDVHSPLRGRNSGDEGCTVPEKIKTIAEVVKTIPDGSHIALGGFAIARNKFPSHTN